MSGSEVDTRPRVGLLSLGLATVISVLVILGGPTAAAIAAPYPPIPPTVSVPVSGAVPPVTLFPAGLNPAAADVPYPASGSQAQITSLQPGQFPVQAATGSPAPDSSTPVSTLIAFSVMVVSAISGGLALVARRSRARS